jgi:hypothetical protein
LVRQSKSADLMVLSQGIAQDVVKSSAMFSGGESGPFRQVSELTAKDELDEQTRNFSHGHDVSVD